MIFPGMMGDWFGGGYSDGTRLRRQVVTMRVSKKQIGTSNTERAEA
jgi:hypothetical protein